jgi:toxin ParE1/3/4
VNAVVVLSPRAEDDLVEIWCTVAADDIRAADELVDELHQVTRLLMLQPMMGRLRPELGSDARSFPHA